MRILTALEAPPTRRSPQLRAHTAIRGKRILYVDDEPLLCRAASRVLRRAGVSCLPAGTHDEAIALAATDRALALAVLDFHMPDGDVGSLVERLRATCPALPLLGTSGTGRCEDFAQYGVTRFIEKPWRPEELVQAVNLACAPPPSMPSLVHP